jgi:tRNA(Ile)-lysidine synthase
VRARLERLAAGGLDGAALAAMAAAAGVERARRDIAVADRLAAHAHLHPAGFARLDPAALGPPDEIALRALARLLACIGGADWPARGASLKRALGRLRGGAVARLTLGRCLIAREGGGWLVVREPACAGPIRLVPGQTARWDGRFAVGLPATAPSPVTVGALGEAGWQALVAATPDVEPPHIPHPARVVLPAFRDLEGLWAVPQLGFVSRSARSIPDLGEPDGPVGRFTPVRPLVPEAGFRAFEQADAGP